MQNNARCHVSRETKIWFERQNILLLAWPPYSPDLNQLEKSWGIHTNIMYSQGHQYDTIQELEVVVKTSLSNIEIDILQMLSEFFNLF